MQKACEKISSIISDYRAGEIPTPDATHVKRWINQFPSAVRQDLLDEMAHILDKTYFSKADVQNFFDVVLKNEKFAGDDPKNYWKGVNFLRLQQAGNSQRDFLKLFDAALKKHYNLSVEDCGATPHTFVYIDDAIFSGGRAKSDLIRWIKDHAPIKAKVAVIVMATHALGVFFATKDIEKAAKEAGKSIEVTWWRSIPIEDRKHYMNNSDVLRPTAIPPEAVTYVEQLGATPILRTGSSLGDLKVFSSSQRRNLVEQEFLKAGVEVRRLCPRLPAQMRPLGSTLMRITGFGSTFITYRNCANNTPLALWAGNPWYPLFPRKTN